MQTIQRQWEMASFTAYDKAQEQYDAYERAVENDDAWLNIFLCNHSALKELRDEAVKKLAENRIAQREEDYKHGYIEM